MNWDCTDTEERLSDFLDGALSAEEAAAFNGHEAGCARCADLVVQVGGLVRRMQRTESVEMPDRLVANILGATLGPRQTQRGLKGWFGWAEAIWEPRFAMGVLTVATSFAIVVHAAGVSPAAIGWADLNPANVARSANRQAHLTYGRALKFVDDLQLVYEIRSQLEPDAQPQGAAPADESAPAANPAPAGGSTPQTAPQSSPDQQTQPAPSAQPKSQLNPSGGPARLGGAERSRVETRNGRLLAMIDVNAGIRFAIGAFSTKGSIR
jgi:hypothetical protein